MKTIFTTVFSDGPGGGNPAPVFVEADMMTEQEMQKAAADLGQESVFVRKPVRPDCDLMLQYFVPDHELTICAHDTIGAITALKEEGLIEKEHLRVETKAGPVQVDWEEDEKGVLVMMEQFLPEFNDGVPSAADVAGALRIPAVLVCDDYSVRERYRAGCPGQKSRDGRFPDCAGAGIRCARHARLRYRRRFARSVAEVSPRL